MRKSLRDTIQMRLAQETGTLHSQGRRDVALVYPATYAEGMASLGYQTVYRELNHLPDTVAQRAFVEQEFGPLFTYEALRPVANYSVVGFSVAYELELGGVLTALDRAGLPLLASERGSRHPWVVIGGPLTFSNPAPLAPFADAIIMGEAEHILGPMLDILFAGGPRHQTLAELARVDGIWVPACRDSMVSLVHCTDDGLPAYSAIWTPGSVLKNMFLVEVERGCSRACTFCVMRKGRGRGMRVVPSQRVLACIPEQAPRVGLVGAAVSDHPDIEGLVSALADSGREVGLSSLRADRLTDSLIDSLKRGGAKTLTVAADAPSERLRQLLHKGVGAEHLIEAASLARAHALAQLKVYGMIGLPSENEADLEELAYLAHELARSAGPNTAVSLALSPFVPKRNTPLWDAPFVGVREAERRLRVIRRAVEPRVRVRPSSARWAWVESVLARSGAAGGRAALRAWQQGGSFAAWRSALGPLEAVSSRGNV